ncbi:hypothetical protein K438DRAFT_1938715 [Mycena galopus ATCC 62051]|nr:hypothetical protein K438DRAFT_1938715 [Mycena galopus ATCC 62051]
MSWNVSERVDLPRLYAPLTTTQVKCLICAYCLRAGNSESLQKCTGCRRVAYCGKKCQKLDWKLDHKQCCPAFQQYNEQDLAMGLTTFELLGYMMRMEARIETLPNPDAGPGAINPMYIRQEVACVACYRTEFQWSPPITFDSCPSCKLVHWCPDHAQSDTKSSLHTPQDCAELKILFSVERVLIDYALARRSRRKIVLFSERPRTSYVRFSQLAGWKDYVRRVYPALGDDLLSLVDEIGGSHPNRATAADALERVVLDATSIVATIMYGLEMVLPDVAQRESLTIHFVGAASYETNGMGIMEELLHHLPKLKVLKLHYIGPEILPELMQGYSDPTRNWACELCKARGWQRFNAVSNLPYHEYMAQNPSCQPDLVVGLNTGFSEVAVESWKKSLHAILRLGVPALFTAYQKEEAAAEWSALVRMGGAEFVLPVEKNQWHGTIPTLNIRQKFLSGQNIGVSCKNQFLYIVKGTEAN